MDPSASELLEQILNHINQLRSISSQFNKLLQQEPELINHCYAPQESESALFYIEYDMHCLVSMVDYLDHIIKPALEEAKSGSSLAYNPYILSLCGWMVNKKLELKKEIFKSCLKHKGYAATVSSMLIEPTQNDGVVINTNFGFNYCGILTKQLHKDLFGADERELAEKPPQNFLSNNVAIFVRKFMFNLCQPCSTPALESEGVCLIKPKLLFWGHPYSISGDVTAHEIFKACFRRFYAPYGCLNNIEIFNHMIDRLSYVGSYSDDGMTFNRGSWVFVETSNPRDFATYGHFLTEHREYYILRLLHDSPSPLDCLQTAGIERQRFLTSLWALGVAMHLSIHSCLYLGHYPVHDREPTFALEHTILPEPHPHLLEDTLLAESSNPGPLLDGHFWPELARYAEELSDVSYSEYTMRLLCYTVSKILDYLLKVLNDESYIKHFREEVKIANRETGYRVDENTDHKLNKLTDISISDRTEDSVEIVDIPATMELITYVKDLLSVESNMLPNKTGVDADAVFGLCVSGRALQVTAKKIIDSLSIWVIPNPQFWDYIEKVMAFDDTEQTEKLCYDLEPFMPLLRISKVFLIDFIQTIDEAKPFIEADDKLNDEIYDEANNETGNDEANNEANNEADNEAEDDTSIKPLRSYDKTHWFSKTTVKTFIQAWLLKLRSVRLPSCDNEINYYLFKWKMFLQEYYKSFSEVTGVDVNKGEHIIWAQMLAPLAFAIFDVNSLVNVDEDVAIFWFSMFRDPSSYHAINQGKGFINEQTVQKRLRNNFDIKCLLSIEYVKKILRKKMTSNNPNEAWGSYKALIALAEFQPKNSVDPIMGEAINPNDRVCISTGHQLSLETIAGFHRSRNPNNQLDRLLNGQRALLNPMAQGVFESVWDENHVIAAFRRQLNDNNEEELSKKLPGLIRRDSWNHVVNHGIFAYPADINLEQSGQVDSEQLASPAS